MEGAAVEPGMRLFRIAQLDEVWVEADVYEGDLAHVRRGQTATVTLDYLPGRSYAAKVAYVYSVSRSESRTGRVRVVLAKQAARAPSGMYATVEPRCRRDAKLLVPSAAVVYTGPRRLVFLDLGEGRLRPARSASVPR